jgi:hypothetical protein
VDGDLMAIDETHSQREARTMDRLYQDRIKDGACPVETSHAMGLGPVGGTRRFSAYGELCLTESRIERQLEHFDRAERTSETFEAIADVIERQRVKLRAELEDVRAQMAQHEAQGTADLLEDIDSADL